MDVEVWKDINGYEGMYQVCDQGIVKSLERVVECKNGMPKTIKSHIMAGSDNGHGYKTVMLSRNGEKKRYYIHRLVAEAFLPNPDNLPEINHKNEDRSDNRLANLEWTTCLDNRTYGTRLERVAKSQSFEVNQYDLDGNYIATYKSIKEASRKTNIGDGQIGSCTKGKAITAGGFIWRTTNNPNVVPPKNKSIKSVDQYDTNGNYIATYEKIKDAANKYNIEMSQITGCCHRRYFTAGGFVWRYHGEELGEIGKIGRGVSQIDINTGEIVKQFNTIKEAADYINGDPSSITKCCKHKAKIHKGYKWEYS